MYLKTRHLHNSIPFAEAQDSTSGPGAFGPGLGSQFRIFVAQSNAAENFDAQIKDKQETNQRATETHKNESLRRIGVRRLSRHRSAHCASSARQSSAALLLFLCHAR